MPLGKLTLFHRVACGAHGSKRVHIRALLVVPGMKLAVFVAVQCTFAGHGHILYLIGVNQRRVAIHFGPFPTGQHGGQVIFRLGTEQQRGPFADVQIDPAFQMNRTVTLPFALGNDDPATAVRTGLFDCRHDCRAGIAAFGIEVGDQIIAIGNIRWLDRLDNFRGFIPVRLGVIVAVQRLAQGCRGGQHRGKPPAEQWVDGHRILTTAELLS